MTRAITLKDSGIKLHGHKIYEDDEWISILLSSITIPKKSIEKTELIR
jgi:hypothetical protein